jgi:hypothetical protein
MPHVQIRGEIVFQDIWRRFEPLKLRDPCPISVDKPYMKQDGQVLLFHTTVVESGRSQRFYLLVASKPDGVMVRIDPVTDPVKTDGVKRALALLAEWIRSLAPGATYGVTNIGEFLTP